MEFLQPATWREALEMKTAQPQALPIAGGTDVLVDLNFDRHRPEVILDLNRVTELSEWQPANGRLRVGAGVSYSRVISELSDRLPGLALASRSVGSPQIRNRGTVGGNLGSASPAGDAHPALLATRASIEVSSVRGSREIPVDEFFLGPKRNALKPDELIAAFWLRPAPGPQQFAKVGTRNAMVIAVCSFGLALDVEQQTVGTGIGSAGPIPLRAGEAERFLAEALADGNHWRSGQPLPQSARERFGELVAQAARPIDDVRGTAAFRRRALAVLARRTFAWAWQEYTAG
ncbi:MAG: FAD binding domain-containing protein [Candidatus Dormibacter sp.]|uniref:FAD binding domain-containing protein n=1 Tax=Candidatus Dormibacter sp. TaxID=2973982 RepID=UPI000DB53918|nr:MAG: carbon monoxide dehydrogenase [Candidatus Dormibacteraeota bacterium]